MATHSDPSSSTRNLTTRYVASLSAIAGLAILGQVLVQQMLVQQTKDVQIISAAQNRQTLCQQVVKASFAVQLAQTLEARQERLAELQDAITQWDSSRQVVRQELRSMFSDSQLTELQPILKKAGDAAQEITTAARDVLENVHSPAIVSPQRPLRRQAIQATTNLPGEKAVGLRLLKAEREYIQRVDQVIAWHGKQAKERVGNLQRLEFGLLGLTLAILIFEGILIFRPAVNKLQQTLSALGKSLKETQAMAKKLAAEQEKSERLLLNILPEAIADRLKQTPQSIADGFAEATVLFADVVGFTEMTNRMEPTELVARLNQIFSCFDALAEKHGLEKIKTIGDAYMVVGGLPNLRADHAEAIADMALDMQKAIEQLNQETGESFSMRIGINTGPVVAGVIGIKKFIYDLWGDTVNIASRMESQGMPGQIQVTEAIYRRLQNTHRFEERGIIPIKGKGNMRTYWLKQRAGEMIGV
ncbi:adenylate/guanylate cyclase domain-containing protein [Leptothermofonsia sp. ETS-13]|uniref:adenylate/guanylate cyclase domain-containing protein n=1 Tax=Leptothermofonsia sp. ETS-13 TaxID=3035696 RepID=UPI003BA0B3D9